MNDFAKMYRNLRQIRLYKFCNSPKKQSFIKVPYYNLHFEYVKGFPIEDAILNSPLFRWMSRLQLSSSLSDRNTVIGGELELLGQVSDLKNKTRQVE